MLEKIVWWIEATWGRYKLYRKLKKDNIKIGSQQSELIFMSILFHTH